MIVSELITELQLLDPDTRVFVDGYEFGLDDPKPLRKVKVALNVRTKDYAGAHADVVEDAWLVERGHEIVDGILIPRTEP